MSDRWVCCIVLCCAIVCFSVLRHFWGWIDCWKNGLPEEWCWCFCLKQVELLASMKWFFFSLLFGFLLLHHSIVSTSVCPPPMAFKPCYIHGWLNYWSTNQYLYSIGFGDIMENSLKVYRFLPWTSGFSCWRIAHRNSDMDFAVRMANLLFLIQQIFSNFSQITVLSNTKHVLVPRLIQWITLCLTV